MLWNNFWYAGRYSFVTYSLLYYPLAALLGIRLLAVATIALAALAFAVVLWREWGATTRWSSRSFAVVWAGIVLSAAFPFALGIALALLAIWALQAGARWRFAALAALTLAASPLAFLLLVIVLAGVALSQRTSLRGNWVPFVGDRSRRACSSSCCGGSSRAGGTIPFPLAEAASGAVVLRARARVHLAGRSARVLRFVFAVYLAACRRVVPRAVGGRREHRAAALRGDPARSTRSLAPALASARARTRRRLGLAIVVEPDAARVELRERAGGRDSRADRVAGGDLVPARAPRRRLPRRGGRHAAATGRPSTSRTRGSRSPAAGSARTTFRRTSCSTASSARPRTWPGCAASA